MFDVKDIKSKIDQMVEKIKTDDTLKEQFKKDPIKAVESVLGVDLPDEAVKKIIAEQGDPKQMFTNPQLPRTREFLSRYLED